MSFFSFEKKIEVEPFLGFEPKFNGLKFQISSANIVPHIVARRSI